MTGALTAAATALRNRALLLAAEACEACAVTICDRGAEFRLVATVTAGAGADLLTLHVVENAVLDARASKALGRASLDAVRSALAAAGIRTNLRGVRGKDGKLVIWHPVGYYLHRAFHTDGRYCKIVLVAAEAA
jgi:hypothetical protein